MATDTPLLDNSSIVVEHEEEKPLKIVHKFGVESKKIWKIAGPAILTALSQFSLGALTSTFVGHVGELQLAAFSVENSVIAGFAFGFLVRKLFIYILLLHYTPLLLFLFKCV
jgi:MATE family multidrug resistance protein